ncbi:HNH endonuclease [Stenotrophomonas bentonitica]
MDLPFIVGALYNRRTDIHQNFGGQERQGICTPKDQPFIIAFTGEAGTAHGYADFWDDDEVFHYFGEGQSGDMRDVRGNRAIKNHVMDGKRILIFQMMGKSRPYRFLGEFILLSTYTRPETPDTRGNPREAIVFRLRSLSKLPDLGSDDSDTSESDRTGADSVETTRQSLVSIRTKQRLFRERLIGVERGCRLTGVEDLRFLRASHIKPWSKSDSTERTDGHNGLLLTPCADLLFDQGWISFRNDGKVLFSEHLPVATTRALGLHQRQARCSNFSTKQCSYLEFHRDLIYQG